MTVGQYVTAAGLKIPSVDDIRLAIGADLRASIDPLLNTEADSPTGQAIGPFASQLREAWEVLQIAFNGLDPDAAEGALLENTSAITGTKREDPFPSQFQGAHRLDVTISSGIHVPIGTEFRVNGDPTTRFQTSEDIHPAIAGTFKVAAKCTVNGPIHCNAGTLTVIGSPLIGLVSVNNAFDAELGSLGDDDADLRVRREQELRATGAANPDAIRADLLAIQIDGDNPVLACTVLWNDFDIFDPYQGLPAHSIECIVYDGPSPTVPDDTIAQVIWDSKGGGIQAIGTSSGVALDSLGAKHFIFFTRPTVLDIAIQITIKSDPDTYAGDDAVKAAILAMFALKVKKSGALIVCSNYNAAVSALTGILDITGTQLKVNGLGAFPAIGVNFQLGLRQIAISDTAWITIVQV